MLLAARDALGFIEGLDEIAFLDGPSRPSRPVDCGADRPHSQRVTLERWRTRCIVTMRT
jgi:hypothetical protein